MGGDIELIKNGYEKINKITDKLQELNSLIYDVGLKLPTKILGVYGELLVIKELLKQENAYSVTYNNAHSAIDLKMKLISNKEVNIEVKTSTIKGGVFGNGYDAGQKGKFDFLVLVGIDTSKKEIKPRFFIFNKAEADKFEPHPPYEPIYWKKQTYIMYILLKEKISKKFSDFVNQVNNNLESFEDKWDKIK